MFIICHYFNFFIVTVYHYFYNFDCCKGSIIIEFLLLLVLRLFLYILLVLLVLIIIGFLNLLLLFCRYAWI